MGYRYPGNETKLRHWAVPRRRKEAGQGRSSRGADCLSDSDTPCWRGEQAWPWTRDCGAIADSGVNLAFMVTQVIGRRYSAFIRFESDGDAKKSPPLLKKAVPQKHKKV